MDAAVIYQRLIRLIYESKSQDDLKAAAAIATLVLKNRQHQASQELQERFTDAIEGAISQRLAGKSADEMHLKPIRALLFNS